MIRIKCFSDVIGSDHNYTMVDMGVRTIKTERITGTVDKCGELNEQFRYVKRKSRMEHQRRHQIITSMENGVYFNPVDVYLFAGEYYVIDGNRRVAAAKELKGAYIDAHVIECVSQNDPEAAKGLKYKMIFESETDMTTVVLADDTGYGTLLHQLREYPEENTLKEKAKLWKSNVFLPACESINQSGLPSRFPDVNAEDLYVRIVNFYHDFMGGVPEYASFDTLISGYMFARKIPEYRPLRTFPLNLLARLFGDKR